MRLRLLLMTLSVALDLQATVASALPAHPRLQIQTQAGLGVTVQVSGLRHAPFPDGKAPYSEAAAWIFVPAHYRRPAGQRVDLVLHFHGHRTTAEESMRAYRLREQFAASRQNAMLVLPQGPVRASDSRGGKLEHAGGLRRFLDELRRQLSQRALRQAIPALPRRIRPGRLVLSAHSGGWRVIARALKHPDHPPVAEVYLFDALYADELVFRDWLVSAARRKLISYYADRRVARRNALLMRALRERGHPFVHEIKEGTLSRRALTRSTAIFIRASGGHHDLLHEVQALRDCLYASSLRRFVRSDWFRHRGPRPLEPRP